MAINKEELIKKAAEAANPEEMKEIVDSAGVKISDEEAAQLFEKVQKQELSQDELEAVSGGSRDWPVEGCAATVEADSQCWSNDSCVLVEVIYDHPPVNRKCHYCQHRNAYWVRTTGLVTQVYHCCYCGKEFEEDELF